MSSLIVLSRRLIFQRRIRDGEPSTFRMRHVCSSLPDAVSVIVTSMPSVMDWTVSVLPLLSEQAIVLTPPEVVSVTCASPRLRTCRVSTPIDRGSSVRNHAKPLTCPLRGTPSGMRNLSEPSSPPSRASQFPSSHPPQLSHPSSDRSSFSSMPSAVDTSCVAVPLHTLSPPIETVPVAVSPFTVRFVAMSG